MKHSLPLLRPSAVAALLFALALTGSAQPVLQQGYVLGPEDVIIVNVIDQPKFSGEYLVPESGVITLPVVGAVTVTGKTLEELRQIALVGLKKRLLHPEVTVTLKVPRPKRVYVFGDVQKGGILDWKQGWRVQEALGAAGGLVTGIEQRDVRVVLEKAETKERIELPLVEALQDTANPKLTIAPGDVLRFQSLALTPIYVAGKVKQPGIYRMREGEAGVLEAIAQAGGVTPEANITSVRIARATGEQELVDISPAILDAKPVQLPKLRAGDMIVVSEAQEKVVVLGYVKQPGYYPIPSGRTYTLAQAVALAGGEARGRITRIGLVRVENGKDVRRVYDLGKYLTKGDPNSNPTLQPGDIVYVPESNRIEIAQILSGLASSALLFNNIRR